MADASRASATRDGSTSNKSSNKSRKAAAARHRDEGPSLQIDSDSSISTPVFHSAPMTPANGVPPSSSTMHSFTTFATASQALAAQSAAASQPLPPLPPTTTTNITTVPIPSSSSSSITSAPSSSSTNPPPLTHTLHDLKLQVLEDLDDLFTIERDGSNFKRPKRYTFLASHQTNTHSGSSHVHPSHLYRHAHSQSQSQQQLHDKHDDSRHERSHKTHSHKKSSSKKSSRKHAKNSSIEMSDIPTTSTTNHHASLSSSSTSAAAASAAAAASSSQSSHRVLHVSSDSDEVEYELPSALDLLAASESKCWHCIAAWSPEQQRTYTLVLCAFDVAVAITLMATYFATLGTLFASPWCHHSFLLLALLWLLRTGLYARAIYKHHVHTDYLLVYLVSGYMLVGVLILLGILCCKSDVIGLEQSLYGAWNSWSTDEKNKYHGDFHELLQNAIDDLQKLGIAAFVGAGIIMILSTIVFILRSSIISNADYTEQYHTRLSQYEERLKKRQQMGRVNTTMKERRRLRKKKLESRVGLPGFGHAFSHEHHDDVASDEQHDLMAAVSPSSQSSAMSPHAPDQHVINMPSSLMQTNQHHDEDDQNDDDDRDLELDEDMDVHERAIEEEKHAQQHKKKHKKHHKKSTISYDGSNSSNEELE